MSHIYFFRCGSATSPLGAASQSDVLARFNSVFPVYGCFAASHYHASTVPPRGPLCDAATVWIVSAFAYLLLLILVDVFVICPALIVLLGYPLPGVGDDTDLDAS